MDLSETPTHSFIIRIWIEETAEEAGAALWRGHITHVPSGRRYYVQTLDEVVQIIAACLEQMHADNGWRWRLIRLLLRRSPAPARSIRNQ